MWDKISMVIFISINPDGNCIMPKDNYYISPFIGKVRTDIYLCWY